MKYLDFYKILKNNDLISSIWEHALNLFNQQLECDDKDSYLCILAIMFSFVDDGNVGMSLDKTHLLSKWDKNINGAKIQLIDQNKYTDDLNTIQIFGQEIITKYLGKLIDNISTLIGENKFFEIEENYLYIRKYNTARKNISNDLRRLFTTHFNNVITFKPDDILTKQFTLTKGQQEAFDKGINNNLIITGGPGTGKTTSILFLLFNIIYSNPHANIYLTAPSGKASNRMKESIIDGLDSSVDETFKLKHPELIEQIRNLQEYTIHRLLSVDGSLNKFRYNSTNQFEDDSVFIIDEASMIDIEIFMSLLSAIPTNARVFIMGDKDQLPSVEAGSVLQSILNIPYLKDNIVRLNESKRFNEETIIYELADKINNGEKLPVNSLDWLDYDLFKIFEITSKKPVFYYKNEKLGIKSKNIIQSVVMKWSKHFYSELKDLSKNIDPNDLSKLDKLYSISENAKILTAENESIRGVKYINRFIKTNFVAADTLHHPGQIMMINTNNKNLDLYNGDSGILVTFQNDPTLYFMCQKSSMLIENDGKQQDKIFKLGKYIFYPLRLIPTSEIDLAYAITIHKSQGSGYPNILVILPNTKGHPLLNRQIVYTAITRTKGNTYILSNQEILESARDAILNRETNIK